MEKIILIGRVVGEPSMELTAATARSPQGSQYLKLSIVTVTYTNKDQTQGEIVRYLSIFDKKFINKFNAICQEYGAYIGMTLMVEGVPRVSLYTAKDGTQQASLNVDAISSLEWITNSYITPVHIPQPQLPVQTQPQVPVPVQTQQLPAQLPAQLPVQTQQLPPQLPQQLPPQLPVQTETTKPFSQAFAEKDLWDI